MQYSRVVMDMRTRPRAFHSSRSNSRLGDCGCLLLLSHRELAHARNGQSLMIVDFLSIDRRHLFHAIVTISSFRFAIAMVLHEPFALLKLLNAI